MIPVADRMEDRTFYEVAAQVIPVLFLALAVENRFWETSNDPSPTTSVVSLSVVLLGATGEMVCISALTTDRTPTETEEWVVIVAIAMLFLPIINKAAFQRISAIGNAWPWTVWIGNLLIVLFPLAIFGIAIADVNPVPYIAGAAFGFWVIATFANNVAVDLKRRHELRRTDKEKPPDGDAAARSGSTRRR